jgi:hypothetical protein
MRNVGTHCPTKALWVFLPIACRANEATIEAPAARNASLGVGRLVFYGLRDPSSLWRYASALGRLYVASFPFSLWWSSSFCILPP